MPKLSQPPAEIAPSAPGAFRADGSFDPEAPLSARGSVDSLVRALVNRRREGRLAPEEAARVIEAANAQAAFPNLTQWANIHSLVDLGAATWPLAWTGSSAEEAVKRAGRGSEGHWCGELWLQTSERDCSSPGHRAVRDPQRVQEHVSGLLGRLSVQEPKRAVSRTPESKPRISDELFFEGREKPLETP